MAGFKNKLYFTGQEYAPYDSVRLRECDPAAGMVTLVPYKPSGYHPTQFHIFGNKLYFLDSDGSGFELFSYDGTNSPQQLTNLGQDNESGIQYKGTFNSLAAQERIVYYKGKIYFFARVTKDANYIFMAYDINSKSASVVHDFGVKDDSVDMLAVYYDKLYIRTKSIQHNNGKTSYLFSYDGTGSPVIVDTALSSPSSPVIYKDDLYLQGTLSTGGKDVRGVYHFNDSDLTSAVQKIIITSSASLYPNPATNNATLEFTLHSGQQLNLVVTDITGRSVYTLPAQTYPAGKNKMEIPAKALPNGIYNCRLATANNVLIWSGKLLKE